MYDKIHRGEPVSPTHHKKNDALKFTYGEMFILKLLLFILIINNIIIKLNLSI
jgi:hypothetical protein